MAEHGLTQDEREALWEASGWGHTKPTFEGLLAAVEAILTARLAQQLDEGLGGQERIEYLTMLNSEQAALIRQAQETLDSCREQRTDLLELLDVEREQFTARLADAWDEGYEAALDRLTAGSNPYRAALAPGTTDNAPETEGDDRG